MHTPKRLATDMALLQFRNDGDTDVIKEAVYSHLKLNRWRQNGAGQLALGDMWDSCIKVLTRLVSWPWFQGIMMIIIMLNVVVLTMMRPNIDREHWNQLDWVLFYIDLVCTIIFTFEGIMLALVYGLNRYLAKETAGGHKPLMVIAPH